MQKEGSLLNQHRMYLIGLVITMLAASLFLLINGKETAFISLNNYHPFYLNVFFINYTFIGDGIFSICLILLVFFYFRRPKLGFALFYSFLLSGLVTQVLKNLINSPRPKLYFEAGTYLHFIDGVTLSGSSGFPSGHTATAFAIATVLALMVKNKKMQLVFLLGASLVGYSRIYLAQHFLIDVIAGALFGSMSGLLAVYLAQNRISIRRSIKEMHKVPSGSVSTPTAIQTT